MNKFQFVMFKIVTLSFSQTVLVKLCFEVSLFQAIKVQQALLVCFGIITVS